MKEKITLYLDLDDTVKDTERYIRKVLSSNGVCVSDSGSVYRFIKDDSVIGSMVCECLKDWGAIPLIDGVYPILKLLQTEYNVVFCSAYVFEEEARAKKTFANSLSCEIILCGEDNKYKDKIDMSGAIFVDDRSDILIRSKADKKYEIFNPYIFDKYDDRDDRTLVVDWYSLADILLGRGVESEDYSIEKFRGLLCKGIQA